VSLADTAVTPHPVGRASMRILCAAVVLLVSASVSQAQFETDSLYRLTTQWQGRKMSLDIVNDGQNNNQPILAKSEKVSGQMWKITPLGDGYYRLTTEWQGPDKSLDIINDDTDNKPILAKTGDFTGQMWRITDAGNGFYKLTTRWQGDARALDIINDGKDNNRPILAESADVSGQLWKISKINQ